MMGRPKNEDSPSMMINRKDATLVTISVYSIENKTRSPTIVKEKGEWFRHHIRLFPTYTS